MRTIRELIRCHWASRRLQRYLDADPAAALSAEEISRLVGHLDVCRECQQAESDYRQVTGMLRRLRPLREPDAAAVERIRARTARATHQELP